MNYSLNVITTWADCDAILTLAGKEKADLEYRKTSLQRQIDQYAENSVEVATELQVVNSELAALTTIIGALPEGESKEENITRLKRLEVKQRVLNDRKNDYGVVALLDKQLSFSRTEKDLVETGDFITTIQNHRATLSA